MNVAFHMTAIAQIIILIQFLSLSIMAAFLWEFHHIHTKRVTFLHVLGYQSAHREYIKKYILMGIYLISTIAITLGTLAFFFSQAHELTF
ncbi:hypothetical protein HYZ98_01715 [Candidatus Peregrinibacteria bacterium]|nr:hypothetical protein [Candidatus Peregrinibacteria bacterium]